MPKPGGTRKPNKGGYVRVVTRAEGRQVFEARYCGEYLGLCETRGKAEELIRFAQERDARREKATP